MQSRLIGFIALALASCGPSKEERDLAKASRAAEDAAGAVNNALAAMPGGDLNDPDLLKAISQEARDQIRAHCDAEPSADCMRLGLIGASFTLQIERRFSDRSDVKAVIAACKADYTNGNAVDFAQVGGCINVGRGLK